MMPRLSDTPVATTVSMARPRSISSRPVPPKGDTPWRRWETRSSAAAPISGTSSTAGVPSRRCSERRSMAVMSGALAGDPSRSARNPAVQWTTVTPAGRTAASRRPTAWSIPEDDAAPASSGKLERSPTTPRWISMVSTAVCRGCSRSVSSTGMARTPCCAGPPRSGSDRDGGDDGVGPAVVGLAARGPLHLVHQVQLAGHLVPGDVLAAVVLHRLEGRGVVPGARLHDGGDPLAPALVGSAHDDGVHHVGMRAHDRLDLFGEDLLATGVDADRAPPEQRH